jgi:hypothetical protein
MPHAETVTVVLDENASYDSYSVEALTWMGITLEAAPQKTAHDWTLTDLDIQNISKFKLHSVSK